LLKVPSINVAPPGKISDVDGGARPTLVADGRSDRDDRWVELYGKKFDELIGVLKTKGVPDA
jgi:uncharacterized protein